MLVTSCSGNWWKHVPQGRVISLSQHLLACVGGTLVGGPSDLDIYLWEHDRVPAVINVVLLQFYIFITFLSISLAEFVDIVRYLNK